MYRYYRRKVGPKVDVAPILVTLLTAISIFQVSVPCPFSLKLVARETPAVLRSSSHGPALLPTFLFPRVPAPPVL
jgi:hypothetical protein